MEQEASEILTTGWCPLNCKYCYIPKTENMIDMHKNIAEKIRSGEIFELLKEVHGNNLKFLGFWGTEPTLTLPLIGEKIPMIMSMFPKMEQFDFSTSMILDPDIIFNFVKQIIPYKLSLKLQVSIDGPSWITDKNRMEGATEKIVRNSVILIKKLNQIDLQGTEVIYSWKVTHSDENIKTFLSNPSLIKEFRDFFIDFGNRLRNVNINKTVKIGYGSYCPTLMVPGKYTSEDGKLFAAYLRKIHEMGFETTYTARLLRLFKYEKELPKHRQFTCSAGDSQLGIGKNIHMCHRTFYLDEMPYVESILKQESTLGDMDNWDVSLFEKERIDWINKNYIIDPTNKYEKARFSYVMRGYHDFWKLQRGYVYAIMKELAYSGQVDPVYLYDEKLLELFTLYLNSAFSCPMENLLNTGTIHFTPVSLLRMMGNGAFQEILRETKKVIGEGKDVISR